MKYQCECAGGYQSSEVFYDYDRKKQMEQSEEKRDMANNLKSIHLTPRNRAECTKKRHCKMEYGGQMLSL